MVTGDLIFFFFRSAKLTFSLIYCSKFIITISESHYSQSTFGFATKKKYRFPPQILSSQSRIYMELRMQEMYHQSVYEQNEQIHIENGISHAYQTIIELSHKQRSKIKATPSE